MFTEMFNQQQLIEEITAGNEVLEYYINNKGCSIKIENQSPYAVDIEEGQHVIERVNPYSFVYLKNGDYKVIVNAKIKSENTQPYNFVSFKTVTGNVQHGAGATTFGGTINAEITNSEINANITNSNINASVTGDVNATITNAEINANVTGNVEANITNATINTNITNAAPINIAGNVNATLTNSEINANITNPNINANITNSVINTQTEITNNVSATITNASIPVTGNVNATIQNASIPVTGNVNATIQNTQLEVIGNVGITSGSVNATIQNASLNSEVINAKIGTNDMVLLGTVTLSQLIVKNVETLIQVDIDPKVIGVYDTLFIVFKQSNEQIGFQASNYLIKGYTSFANVSPQKDYFFKSDQTQFNSLGAGNLQTCTNIGSGVTPQPIDTVKVSINNTTPYNLTENGTIVVYGFKAKTGSAADPNPNVDYSYNEVTRLYDQKKTPYTKNVFTGTGITTAAQAITHVNEFKGCILTVKVSGIEATTNMVLELLGASESATFSSYFWAWQSAYKITNGTHQFLIHPNADPTAYTNKTINPYSDYKDVAKIQLPPYFYFRLRDTTGTEGYFTADINIMYMR